MSCSVLSLSMAGSLLRYYHIYPVISSRSSNPKIGRSIRIQCSDSSSPKGFQPKSRNPSNDDNKRNTKSSPKQSFTTLPNRAPGISSQTGGGSTKYASPDDLEFEQRLQAVKKSALEQKKAEQVKEYGPIDYDAPTEKNESTIGLGTKIGIGIAVAVFGLVFAFGDFLPIVSVTSTEEASTVETKIPEEERKILEKRLKQFEETLAISPDDSTALEGAAVTLAEMREYKRASAMLEILNEKKPDDPDVFRLLGEVKYELKDYEGSVASYKSAERASKDVDFEILRGLTNSLLAAKKPDEAVQVVLASRERLNKDETRSNVDTIQVDLLLGKAYSDWGHISDAVSVYDQLISKYPNDFRGYLAKGIILKENGSIGDAERMFIQARFFAPDKAKAFVDKYSR